MYTTDENTIAVTEILRKRLERLCSMPPEQAKEEGKRNLLKLGLIDENCNYLVAFVSRNIEL